MLISYSTLAAIATFIALQQLHSENLLKSQYLIYIGFTNIQSYLNSLIDIFSPYSYCYRSAFNLNTGGSTVTSPKRLQALRWK